MNTLPYWLRLVGFPRNTPVYHNYVCFPSQLWRHLQCFLWNKYRNLVANTNSNDLNIQEKKRMSAVQCN